MYNYISGKAVYLSSGKAVIDNGGIGYEIIISDRTLGKINALRDENVKLFVHFLVREDEMSLYGFFDEEEKRIFELLISVSGVGPKAAMAILSILSPDKFALCVMSNDAKSISAAQGIGIRTAQKIILELHDKIGKEYQSQGMPVSVSAASVKRSEVNEALEALEALGYQKNDALRAISFEGSDKMGVEELIRNGLKRLTRE